MIALSSGTVLLSISFAVDGNAIVAATSIETIGGTSVGFPMTIVPGASTLFDAGEGDRITQVSVVAPTNAGTPILLLSWIP